MLNAVIVCTLKNDNCPFLFVKLKIQFFNMTSLFFNLTVETYL